MRIKRDADAPATVQAKKQRPALSENAAQAQAQAQACVDEYFDRFRNRNERNGTNARGGGTQTVTDATIMQSLRELRSLKGPKAGAALHRFLVAYGVVRTFAGLGKLDAPGKYKKLAPLAAKLIEAHKRHKIHEVLVAAVMAACKDAGFGTNLSFATKALCMLGNKLPIYSSESVAYLKKFHGHRVDRVASLNDHYIYYLVWNHAFDEVRSEYIAAARRRLGQHSETKALEDELGAEWFAMRGFDVHLMAVGGPLRK